MVKVALVCASLLAFLVSPAQAQQISIPSGTMLHCRLSQTITTQANHRGDSFTATVSEPIMIDGREAIPYGARIDGRISWLERPGRVRGVGEIRLTPEKVVMPDGSSLPLSAILSTVYGAEGAKVKGEEGGVKGPSARVKDLEEIGASMGGGGVLGTIFGGLHGALIGGAIGGAAGLVDTLRKRGPDLALPTGTQLNYQLTRDLVIQNAGAEQAPGPGVKGSR